MKFILFLALATAATVIIFAAVVLRSRRAWDALHTMRKYGWIYVAIIVIGAVYRLWID